MGTLEKRIRRLERWNVGLLAVAGLACLMAARGPGRVITAERIDIEDDKGKVRATFGLQEGSPGMRFMDADGRPRLLASYSQEFGSQVQVIGKNPVHSLAMIATADGSVAVMGKSPRSGFEVHADASGQAGLKVDGRESNTAVYGVDSEGDFEKRPR